MAWRLLGGNHRELARSADVFADVAECRAGIGQMVTAIAAGAGGCQPEPLAGGWMWSFVAAGLRLAVSSRGYQRLPECTHNISLFLVAAPAAAAAMVIPATVVQRRSEEALEAVDDSPPR